MSLLVPGRCRHCGCGGESCRLPDGDLCVFTDRERLVCSAQACQIAEADRRARAVEERKASVPRSPRDAWRAASIAMSRQGLNQELINEILARRRDRAKRRKGRRAA
ncbi:hypothetical protein [Occallatibacter riparius]|uniref:Uncharacterized protein n=1 Tax=Occallatibacter riparius TaxID=1002689 RepID=A0A9J7BPU8_9BACT|nr:hypothetical protein [Occallatibacter riparius]UWZ84623.1 hypothetical protein MOP44_01510 [Occallatibacter riparius]